MNTSAIPLLRGLTGLALLFGAASGAIGQVGTPSDDLATRYGQPLLKSTNALGVQTLTYQKDGFSITAFGRDGVALRVIYQKPKLTEPDVRHLLEINRGEAQWTLWVPPGIPNPDPSITTWMRTDEMVMAVQDGSTFTVTAGAWNTLPQADSTTPPPPPVAAPAPVAVADVKPVTPAIRQKPAMPKTTPAPGDSRLKAIQLLGRPRGNMVSGSKEILLYDWGQVYLNTNTVIKVD